LEIVAEETETSVAPERFQAVCFEVVAVGRNSEGSVVQLVELEKLNLGYVEDQLAILLGSFLDSRPIQGIYLFEVELVLDVSQNELVPGSVIGEFRIFCGKESYRCVAQTKGI
jgi:hypothetical protein